MAREQAHGPAVNAARLHWLPALALVGCSGNGIAPDVGAVRTSITPESKTELEEVLASATGNASVTLADDALASTSVLVLERQRSRSIDQPMEPGRDLGMPWRFQLVIDGRRCFLVDQASGLRWMLNTTTCEPE